LLPLEATNAKSNAGSQGSSQYLTNPTPAKPLPFDLHLGTPSYDDEETTARIEDSDARLMEMLAAQAQHHHDDGPTSAEAEDAVVTNQDLSREEKAIVLQKSLIMAASNGDVDRVKRLVNGGAKGYVDVNAVDDDGTGALVYASCFGHQDVVSALLDAGALVDKQDRNRWSPLMWAMTNRHKTIAKILLDHGANPDIKSTSGGTAYDFVQPGSEFSQYLHANGYHLRGAGQLGDDFYDSGGFGQDRFEEDLAENELKRRMLMKESAANLEVDLSTLGFDESPEAPCEPDEDEEEFVWERCVGDQMFVFQDGELDRILDLIITNMTPQRSPSQKPVPANLVFLMARYAHYHMTESLLEKLLSAAMDRINDVVERHQWDMTMLAFWISNATLLLHYLKKDAGLLLATTKMQLELAELINEIFILIIRDAERRTNKILESAMLDHETIPGLTDDIHFQGEWNVFKSKPKTKDLPPEKRFRPPSPKRRAQTSPRNVTSLLSSTLFVLDLYDVHSVITAQILAQLLYWLGAELFNRVMTTKRFLSRTKAMQIRMNVSVLEDWARTNNRQPEHYENGSTVSTGENTVEAARRHLSPAIQLLQWLQCFTSLGDEHESLVGTLEQLGRLTPTQLIHAVKSYRPEVGEKGLPKAHMKFLVQLQKGQESLIKRPLTPSTPEGASGTATPTQAMAAAAAAPTPSTSAAPISITTNPENGDHQPSPNPPSTASSMMSPLSPQSFPNPDSDPETPSRSLILDPSVMLPFSLPTSTDMLITYGAGIGGTNRERARKYIPSVPTEVLARLNLDAGAASDAGAGAGSGGGGLGSGRRFSDIPVGTPGFAGRGWGD
jgi:DIL domain/Ankyrin repeats (3 copies)